MGRSRRWRLASVVVVGAAAVGCRDREPTPQYFEDLGTEGLPLPPPSSTWKDPRALAGQAEWVAFREPSLTKEAAIPRPGAGAAALAANPKVEEEVRGVLKEYHNKLTSGTPEEIAEFYSEAQADTVKRLVEMLVAFSAKLKDLGAMMPEEQAKLDQLALRLAPASLLKLDVAGIESRGDKAAVAKLTAVTPLEFLPETDPKQISKDVSLTLGDDGYWYIESPVVAALAKAMPSIETAAGELDGLVSTAKGGSARADLIAEKSPAIRKMVDAVAAADPAADPDEAAAEDDSEG